MFLKIRFIVLLICMCSFALSKSFSKEGDNSGADLNADFFENTYLDPACFLYSSQTATDTLSSGGKPQSSLSSKYKRPMTARVIECIDGTMSNLFLKSNPETGRTVFQQFQSVVSSIVVLALILYLAMNGYLIATGQLMREKPKQEIIMFLIKFILVFYFAIGDAWKDFFFVALRSVSSTFGTILMEAGSLTGSDRCIFTGPGMDPYPPGKGYIAIFDALDCKIANYMGWFVDKKFPLLIPIGVTALFAGYAGTIVFTLVFVLTIQLIIIAARVAQLYLTSIMVLTLLLYASPILVPMVLFKYTKSMFDNWLQMILGLTIHPIMVFALTGIMLSVMDRIYYGADPDQNNVFLPPIAEERSMGDEKYISINIQNIIEQNSEFDQKQLDNKKLSQLLSKITTEQSAQISRLEEEMSKLDCSNNNTRKCQDKQFVLKQTQDSMSNLKNLTRNLNLRLDQPIKDRQSKAVDAGAVVVGEVIGVGVIVLPVATAAGVAIAGTVVAGTVGEILNTVTSLFVPNLGYSLENALQNTNAVAGAAINPKCYGGKNLSQAQGFPSLVCVLAWLDDSAFLVGFPIPYFIELFQLYIPKSPWVITTVGIMLIVVIMCIILNVLIGEIFEQMEFLIESISGVNVKQIGAYAGMLSTTIAAAKAGKSGMQSMQDKTFKRKDNAGGGDTAKKGENKNDATTGGGGKANNNDATTGGGDKANNNDATTGGGDSAGGGDVSSATDSAS